ncbi:MAG: GAF domain-containing protein [Burkholderiales bacterium]|nr:GAF domain-containing protein [Burkholderiales bacterium]
MRPPGSVQAQGLLLALQEPGLRITQASANWEPLLGRPLAAWLGQPVGQALGGTLESRVREHLASAAGADSALLRCRLPAASGELALEGTLHRNPDGLLLLELEPRAAAVTDTRLTQQLGHATQALSEAADLRAVAQALALHLQALLGYDRVMVCRFGDEAAADGAGGSLVLAEACAPALRAQPVPLAPFHAAAEIPPAVRALYLRTRLRLLVDSESAPSPLVPARADAQPLDLSTCSLRSLPPSHLQRLRRRGVRAALGLSLVRDGRLWGLVVCHHALPCRPAPALRAAAALLAEAATTRIAALEHFARAQLGLQVRQLSRRLVEATAAEGDWRPALMRDTQALLQPLAASGALLLHDGACLAAGCTPAGLPLQQLSAWIADRPFVDGLFNGELVGLRDSGAGASPPAACGVLAVRLSTARGEVLAWLREAPGAGVAQAPWSAADLGLARQVATALTDIAAQVDAVRWLIAERQAAQARSAVGDSREPMVVADGDGRTFHANPAFLRLVAEQPGREPVGASGAEPGAGGDLAWLAHCFAEPLRVQRLIGQLRAERRPWRGELALRQGGALLRVRAEPVPADDGKLLGLVLLFDDLTASRQADAARQHLEATLAQAGQRLRGAGVGRQAQAPEDLIATILTNASLAAMDIADHDPEPAAAQLQALERSARRAARLYDQLRGFIDGAGSA